MAPFKQLRSAWSQTMSKYHKPIGSLAEPKDPIQQFLDKPTYKII